VKYTIFFQFKALSQDDMKRIIDRK